MPELAVTMPNVPHEGRDQRSRLQYELGEPTYSEPTGVDGALCSVAQFILALCAHRRTRYFFIAGLTDFIDGEIARRYGVITNFGKLMDPLVDKIMVAAAFISLVPLKAVPAWAATTVVARDFLITGLRLMASAKGRILPAETLGKQKTSWQIVTIIFFLALLSIAELHHANETPTWWLRAWGQAGPVLVWITVALTLYSGLGYAWRNRELLAPDQ